MISSKPSKTKDLKDSSIKMSYVEIYNCRQGYYNLVSIAFGELEIVYDSFLDVYGAINPDDLEENLVPQRWFGNFAASPVIKICFLSYHIDSWACWVVRRSLV